ncbi:hypothetical protein TSUD_409630 [Trifolium subterraneum]|uniref:3'-5' exonuclease domain-containing protein n=1 Tax=Trifolium subterraneum TaxID=3900 RepID=A0A2Z6P213_TRISU|nr:hypothetical protein TSUD_409630 [Trifolium subterraneum]
MPSIVDRDRFYNHRDYTVNLHGNEIIVTVTSVASVVRKWLNAALFFRRSYIQQNRLIVGLGVQWTPGGRDPPADTLQLCIGRRCLIFQLAHATYVPRILRNFLRNRNYTFVGFWNHSDRRKLKSPELQLEMYRDPLDLRLYAVAEDEDDDENLAGASVDEIV